jgi:hypothetical protein
MFMSVVKVHNGPLVHGEMHVIIPSNAIMWPTFPAGGATAAAHLGGILAGAGGIGANFATADGFDGIVEDDAGDHDIDITQGLSPTQALKAVRWRCSCSVCLDPNGTLSRCLSPVLFT